MLIPQNKHYFIRYRLISNFRGNEVKKRLIKDFRTHFKDVPFKNNGLTKILK